MVEKKAAEAQKSPRLLALEAHVRGKLGELRAAAKSLAGAVLRVELEVPALLGAEGPSRWTEAERDNVRKALAGALKLPEAQITVSTAERSADELVAAMLKDDPADEKPAGRSPMGDTVTGMMVETGGHPVLPEDPPAPGRAGKTPAPAKDSSAAAAELLQKLWKRPRP